MEKKGNMFLDSAKELKKTSALAVCAMLAALAMILTSVASISIRYSESDHGLLVRAGFWLPVCRCTGLGKVFYEARRTVLFWIHIQCDAGGIHLRLLLLPPQVNDLARTCSKICSHSDCKCIVEYLMA